MIINVMFKKALSLHKSVTKFMHIKKQELCFIITCSLTNVKRVKNMAVIWLLSLLFLISILITAVKRTKQRGGRQPPSPPGLPFIGNLHQLGALPHQSLWELSKKYGPVMLVNLGRVSTVIVSSPETAKQVLRDHDLNCCSRPSVEGIYICFHDIYSMSFSDSINSVLIVSRRKKAFL